MSESSIQSAIGDYLAYKKHLFWRNNSYGIYDVKGGFHRKLPKYSRTGLPDYIVIIKGVFIGLEVKDTKGIQSANQKLFGQDIAKAGGQYHVVRSIDDVIKIGL